MKRIQNLLYRITSSPKQFKTFYESLEKNGYRVAAVDPPSSNDDLEKWLSEKISEVSNSILFESDPDLLRLCRAIRSHKDPSFASRVLFWISNKPTELDDLLLARLVDAGIDDFFSVSQNPLDFLAHLRIRQNQAQQRLKNSVDLKELEIRLAKTETTVKQREEFLGVCSHDLRSPLGLVHSSLSMLLNSNQAKPTLSSFQVELLTRAKRQAAEGLTLVADLLDVMSYEQGLKPQYQMINLHELLFEFYSDYRMQADTKGVGFHYENPVKSWRVLADSDRIRQLLQNLFTNAMKFTDKGKNIFLSVTPFQGRRRNDPPYPMIIISLKDEGQGIPEKEMQKIFDKFSQIKDRTRAEGRGLGLTVAKQISNLHQGNIWVESRQGEGSTFFVLFPHVISRSEVPGGVGNSSSIHKTKRILVVEPTVQKRTAYFEPLERWGFEVSYANDGVEALALLFFQLPDLVVLTSGLTKMGEADVSIVAKADPVTSHIPLIYAVEENRVPKKNAEAILADHTITLPFSQETFLQTIEKILKKQGELAPARETA